VKTLLLLLAFFTAIFPFPALADDSMPLGSKQIQALTLLREQLTQQLASQPNNPDLVYQLGAVAYKLHDYDTALTLFQRARQLNPNHAGAVLDMALTYYAKQDYVQARQLLTQLATLPNLPPQVEEVIASYQARLAELQPSWHVGGSVAIAAGVSNNANQGLATNTVTLPFVDTSISHSLSLQQNEMAQGDHFAELELDGKAQRQWNGSQAYLVASLRGRRWKQYSDFDQGWLMVGGGMVTPLSASLKIDNSLLSVNGWLGTHGLENAVYGLSQLTWQNGLQAHWIRLELDRQHFPADTTYDANQAKIVLGSGLERPNWKWSTEVALMSDHAINNRPGGNRLDSFFTTQGSLKLAPQWWLSGMWQWERDHQEDPFSPALFGSFVRTDVTRTASVSLNWQYAPSYSWELSLIHSELDSTLHLYDLNRKEMRLEWRKEWY
jgi:hypothetical protein